MFRLTARIHEKTISKFLGQLRVLYLSNTQVFHHALVIDVLLNYHGYRNEGFVITMAVLAARMGCFSILYCSSLNISLDRLLDSIDKSHYFFLLGTVYVDGIPDETRASN